MVEKENRNENRFEWRACSSTQEGTKVLSRGISPQRFHNGHNRTKTKSSQMIENFRETVEASLVQQGKRRVSNQQALQRAAFKEVTECRSWPLQKPALDHFKRLLEHHTEASKTCQTSNNNNNKAIVDSFPSADVAEPQESNQDLSGSSSFASSSCSGFSLENDEPKRLLRTLNSSPAKSRYKNFCREEFLQELALPNVQLAEATGTTEENSADSKESRHDFFIQRPALWSMEPCIWAWEINATGKRKYVVGHLGRCMDLYWRKTLAENRHGYELIRENAPCRLYLDIEYSKAYNPHLNDEEASKEFLNALFHDLVQQLKKQFPEQLQESLERRHIVDLDSSTDKKYSRHWIVHLPRHYLFSSNRAVGRFVHEWIGTLIQKHGQQQQQLLYSEQAQDQPERLNPALAKYLMVNTKSGNDSDPPPQNCIVDLGVYTKNRLFRLLGSCKYGKPASAALRIAEENEFPFHPNFGNSHFYKAAATQKIPSTITMGGMPRSSSSSFWCGYDMPELAAVEEYKKAIDWTFHADALAQTFVIPLHSTKVHYPILPELPGFGDGQNLVGIPGRTKINSDRTHASPQSYGPSPFPLLDQFVLTRLASRGGIPGSIRTWSMETFHHTNTGDSVVQFRDSAKPVVMTYYLNRNRYCEHIGRHHKSNGIFWQVDFVTGKAKQRCFDPECRGFSSQPVELPKYIRDHIQEYDSSNEEGQPLTGEEDDTLSEAIRSIRLDDISVTTTIASLDSPTASSAADVLEELPDDALLDAMLANPELFP